MARDLSIADRCRNAGLRVVECAGWQDRGSSDYNPRGSVCHHTAGSANGTAPSLDGVINGHSNSAPGPLANALQSREADGNDIIYVVAAGRTNHAGEGGWHGLSGNSSVVGLEVEHTGVVPLPEGRQRIAARFHAAMAAGRWSSGMVCQHREWAPDRKIDTAQNVDPDGFRRWVDDYIRSPGGGPVPIPEVDEMFVLNTTVAVDEKVLIGLPYGYKSARVDLWLDAPSNEGAALWAAQEYEGGAEAVGLWADGHTWELYLPGHYRTSTSALVAANIAAIAVQNKGPRGPVVVTVSGT